MMRADSAMSLDGAMSFSSEEEQSRTNSFQSTRTATYGPVKKAQARPKTSFQLAHPPPIIKPKQRLKLRPRVLLQLHQLSGTSRPTPALDVLPSTIFAPKLRGRFPRLFKGKDGLGPNDLVVVSSDSYMKTSVTNDDLTCESDEEGWDHREVVATICQLRKGDGGGRGKAEICFEHGPSWEATPLINGGYEFVATDQHGIVTKARWVLRNRPHRRATSMAQQNLPGRAEEEKRFTFSVIHPSTRRHPIIASLNRNNVEVLDQYPSTIPLSSPSNTPLSPSSITSSSTNYFDTPITSTLPMSKTDEQLRTLIVITGIWVVFREGWSRSFSYLDAMSIPPTTVVVNSQSKRRSLMSSVEAAESGLAPSSEQDRSTPGKSRLSGTNPLQWSSVPTNDSSTPKAHILTPKRASSSGAAFMERASTRRSLSAARRISKLATTSRNSTPSSEESSEETPYSSKRTSKGLEMINMQAATRSASQSNPVAAGQSDPSMKEQANAVAKGTLRATTPTTTRSNTTTGPVELGPHPAPKQDGHRNGPRSRRFSRLWSCLIPRRAATR